MRRVGKLWSYHGWTWLSSWLLRGLSDKYGVYVALTGRYSSELCHVNSITTSLPPVKSHSNSRKSPLVAFIGRLYWKMWARPLPGNCCVISKWWENTHARLYTQVIGDILVFPFSAITDMFLWWQERVKNVQVANTSCVLVTEKMHYRSQSEKVRGGIVPYPHIIPYPVVPHPL